MVFKKIEVPSRLTSWMEINFFMESGDITLIFNCTYGLMFFTKINIL